jgi:FMN-dependent NADH-azoreductase
MGTKILRIDASSRTEGSYSREIGDAVVAALLAESPDASVHLRDLAREPLEHIRNETIAGYYTSAEQMSDSLRAATALSDAVIKEVREADVLVISTPMYNFSIPSALKAWIDQLVRIGQTFAYDGKSFTGLLRGKRAIVAVAYGAGGYTNNGPFAAADFAAPYLKFLLRFLGITDVIVVPMEGTTGDEASVAAALRAARLAAARAAVRALAAQAA